jgi:signal transduction histidine kinase/ActR/RegA family two-component response regulator
LEIEMDSDARQELYEALDARTRRFGTRIGLIVGVAVAMMPVLGWAVAPWLACMIALQLGEYTWIIGCKRRGVLKQYAAYGLLVIIINSLGFTGIGMAAVLTGDRWAMLSGVLVMAGALMNAGPAAGSSMRAYITSAGSIALLALPLPLIAYLSGETVGNVWALSLCIVLLFAASFTTRSFAARALIAERRSNAMKCSLLATVSHEIRTPLNGVIGMVQAMAADDLPETQRTRLDIIRQSGEFLLLILNDVLDFSKIEAGKLEREDADFELTAISGLVHAAFAAAADAKGLMFTVDLDEQAKGTYRGDRARLSQVLNNLVSNALKFTEQGMVAMHIRREEGTLEFDVADTGIGIPKDALGRLFNKFEQVDTPSKRSVTGTGLGLAICKELVTLMGGTIEVSSVEGEGSKFRIRIPLQRLGDEQGPKAEVGDAVPPALDGASNLRVLAAEDNNINQLVLRTLLQQAGINVTIVADGIQALASWRKQEWDLILMDVQMPVMDGLSATRAIRLEEETTGRTPTPIIALTANVMSHQITEYAAAGVDGHVAKPINVAELFAAIEGVLARAGPSPIVTSPRSAAPAVMAAGRRS